MLEHYIIKSHVTGEILSEASSVSDLSDGYHTFNELYSHRIELYKALCKTMQKLPQYDGKPEIWKAIVHNDGSVMEGWFIMGINIIPGKTITYHLPMSEWDNCDFARILSVAVKWDGHTSADVLNRLKELI
jgi:hypothetical protein